MSEVLNTVSGFGLDFSNATNSFDRENFEGVTKIWDNSCAVNIACSPDIHGVNRGMNQ